MSRTCTLLRSGAALALAALAVALTGPGAAAATTAPALVIDSDFPDPDVSKFGDTYYAYSTNNGNGNVPVATAPAATGPWTRAGNALPTLGAWATGGKTWAPDVSRRADGTYLLYYTAHDTASGKQCIGTATASAPGGPFTAAPNPLVCNASEGGDIDPSSYVEGGTRYLVYKNDGNAIGRTTSLWLQPVDASGTATAGARTRLLSNDRADEAGVIEAPVLVKRPSRYVLFFSAGPYGGDAYETSYATSTSLTGPYTKAYRPLLTTASLDGAVHGPGGQDVVGDELAFHGWIGNFTARGMYVAALGWSNDLPVVRGSRVRYEAERGTLHGGVVSRADANASQGAVAAKIDTADSWVDLSVYAPRAGSYTVHVVYAAGYGNAQHTLTVNGANPVVVDYPDHGWENFQNVDVGVTLNAGSNTLRFTHRTAFAELDDVEVA